MKLSKDFSVDEFDCHDGTPVPDELLPNLSRLVHTVLQPLRDEWNAPLIIISGYRTLRWNERVGGAETSTHLTLEGCDPKPVHLRDVPRLHALALAMFGRGALSSLGGLGLYKSWIHVDTRRLPGPGRLRRWNGKGIGSEQ